MASDGSDLWVSSLGGQVSRVRASDGKLLETWTALTGALYGILPAMGRVFAVSSDNPGVLAGSIRASRPAR